jgi:hypothetical protein
LRTQWGLQLSGLPAAHADLIKNQLLTINPTYYILKDGVLSLTPAGKLFADSISAELFTD